MSDVFDSVIQCFLCYQIWKGSWQENLITLQITGGTRESAGVQNTWAQKKTEVFEALFLYFWSIKSHLNSKQSGL